MKTSNPVLHNSTFIVDSYDFTQAMTMQGTAIKTFFLLGLATISAGWAWYKLVAIFGITYVQNIPPYITIGSVGAFITALCTTFKPSWSPITAPIYALLEGLALGSSSFILDRLYPGIILQALPLTLGTLAAMLMLYSFGIVQVTHRLRMMVFSALSAICFVYVLSFILSLFGINLPYIHDSSPISILFSLFVVSIAAFKLLLDFDFIQKSQEHGAPKYMEWYSAFALMVTLVWLYFEILLLLAKLRRRRRP